MAYSMRHYSSKTDPLKSWPTVPGAWPLLGHFPYIQSLDNMCAQLEKWADQYGSESGCYEMIMPGGVRTLVVCQEEAAMEIMKQRPQKVYRPPELREAVNSIGATGVFAAEGSQWKDERKLVSAALNHKQLHEHYLPNMKRFASRLIQKWEKDVENSPNGILEGTRADLGGLTADAVCKTVLDEEFDFLNHPERQVARDVRAIMQGATMRSLLPVWYWRIPFIGQYMDGLGWPIHRLTSIIQKTIQDHESETQNNSNGGGTNTYLKKIMSMMHAEKKPLALDRVMGNALTLFLAGTDTTEKALVQALYHLALYPNLQARLREEVADFDWEKASIEDFYSELPKLKSFLHEIHRFYLFPLMFLQTNEDIVFKETTIPKDSQIFVHIRHCTIQKNKPSKDVPFGPNNSHPSIFDPERFLEKTGEGKTGEWTCPDPITTNAAFMMFGSGVKSCPGRKYSELLSYCVLVSVLQTFQDISLAPNHPPVKDTWDTIAISPNRPLQLQFTPNDPDEI